MTKLRVDPGVVRSTGGHLGQVADELAAESPTRSLDSAAHGMAGLQTGAACARAATAFDAQFKQLGWNLNSVAQGLRKAADSYESTDASTGQNVTHAGDAFGR
ncbi:type VII secretion target [Mycobacterium sp.]|uniref:type VII secretion target n=1 Tax=Mycobacterium sp. TaxID=1785 RepID=UPI0031D89367